MPVRGQKAPARSKKCTECASPFMGTPTRKFCVPCKKKRNKSRYAATNAIKRGKLDRKPCAACDAPKSQAHHEDYRRPLDITWLCPGCHSDRHQHLKEATLPLAEWLPEQRRKRWLWGIQMRGYEIRAAITAGSRREREAAR